MPSAGKLTVTLSPDILRLVEDTVASGEFATAGAVLETAMRDWHRQRQSVATDLEAIRTRIQRSIEDSRADLSEEDVDARLEILFAEAAAGSGHAAS